MIPLSLTPEARTDLTCTQIRERSEQNTNNTMNIKDFTIYEG